VFDYNATACERSHVRTESLTKFHNRVQTPSGALSGFGLLNCGPHAAPRLPYSGSENCPYRKTLCTYFNKKHYGNNSNYVNKIRLTHIATVVLALNRNQPQIVTAIAEVAANVNFTNFSCTTCVTVHSMTTALQDRRNTSPYNRVPPVPA
jgi:hypothetical protein